MKRIGITEAKRTWAETVRRVAAGEALVLTRRGRAWVWLVPSTPMLERLATRRGSEVVSWEQARVQLCSLARWVRDEQRVVMVELAERQPIVVMPTG